MSDTAMEIINDRISRWHFCRGEARIVGEQIAIQLRKMIVETGDEDRAMRGITAIDQFIQRPFAPQEKRRAFMDAVLATLSA